MMETHATAAQTNGVSSRLAWMSIGILLVLNILSHVDRTVITLMVEPIKTSLQITDVEFSLLQGLAFTLFYAFASLPMGWIADRWSRHWVIYGGVTIWSICTGLCGLANGFWPLFLARVGVGAGEATLSPASYTLVGDMFPRHKVATAAGVLAAGGAIGAAGAYAIGGMAIAWAQSIPPVLGLQPWQLVFVMVGLPGLLLAPLVFLIPDARRPATGTPVKPATTTISYLSWLRRNARLLIPLLLAIGCNTAQAVGSNVWMPSYLIRHFNMSADETGLILGLVGVVTGTVGFIAAGRLVDWMTTRGVRHPHARFFLFCSALTSLCGLATFTLAPQSLTVTLILWGAVNLFFPITGPAVAFIQHVTPLQFRARTTAILFIIIYLFGMGAGPVIVALFTERVFGGPEQVGSGLAAIFLLFGPLAISLCALTMRGQATNAGSYGRE
jgi:MFS family permease